MKKSIVIIFVGLLSIMMLVFCIGRTINKVKPQEQEASKMESSDKPHGITAVDKERVKDNNAAHQDAPKMFSLDEGGYRGKNQYGYFVFESDAMFLIGDNRKALYRVKEGKSLRIFSDDTIVYDLCEQNGFLYYKNILDIYRVPVDGGMPELILKDVGDFSVYSNMVYARKNGDSSLVAMDINQGTLPIELHKNARIIAAVDGGIIYGACEVDMNSQIPEQFYYLRADGECTLLDVDLYGCLIDVRGDAIYYTKVNFDADKRDYGQICKYNFITGNKSVLYSQEDADPTMKGIHRFCVDDNFIYMYEGRDVSVITSYNIDTGEHGIIMNYGEPTVDYLNGEIDLIHLFDIGVDKGYIFLYGKSYTNGYYVTTRFPIKGAAEGKQEEVFYEGGWLSLKNYYEQREH